MEISLFVSKWHVTEVGGKIYMIVGDFEDVGGVLVTPVPGL